QHSDVYVAEKGRLNRLYFIGAESKSFSTGDVTLTLSKFDLPEYCVRRRYQDFDWLRVKLEETQPTNLIPVGPSSFSGVVDRFSEEFVETRMKALDKFLKRVADHPVLSFNPHLNAFLTAKVKRNSVPVQVQIQRE
uniref:PX domain-containing protein n=1 Tax=Oryzias sinensis TaxID=183150 RepID=A0A8C7WY40_9TELE